MRKCPPSDRDRHHEQSPTTLSDDTALPPKPSADFVGVGLSAFWSGVGTRWPLPFYAAPRAPRWTVGELRRAREKNRLSPSEAKEQRRVAKLEREAAEAEVTAA